MSHCTLACCCRPAWTSQLSPTNTHSSEIQKLDSKQSTRPSHFHQGFCCRRDGSLLFFSPATSAALVSSKNDRLTLGLIGARRMGHNHLRFATEHHHMCDMVAVCDVDAGHREKALATYGHW